MTLRNEVIGARRLEVTYCRLLQGSLDRKRILRAEDEGSTFLRNVEIRLPRHPTLSQNNGLLEYLFRI